MKKRTRAPANHEEDPSYRFETRVGKSTRLARRYPSNLHSNSSKTVGSSAPELEPAQAKAATRGAPRRSAVLDPSSAAAYDQAIFGPEFGASLPSSDRLPAPLQAKMERSFSADFSAVRIHHDDQAAALGARAFTRGVDIHFAPGAYDPNSPSGQELVGHELAHVVQQSEGRVRATRQFKGVSLAEDPSLEQEADVLGAKAARGEVARVGSRLVAQRSSAVVARKAAKKHALKKHKRGWRSVAGKRTKTYLEELRDQEKFPISDDEIAVFDAMSKVETQGRIGGVNTYDTGVVSIGFMQATLKHGYIDHMMKRAAPAFGKYGIHPGDGYWKIGSYTVRKIKGAAHWQDLRERVWAERFLRASMDPKVVMALIHEARKKHRIAKNKARKHNDRENPLWNDLTVRCWLTEAYNNLPMSIVYGLKLAKNRGINKITKRDAFLDMLAKAIIDGYARCGRGNKGRNVIRKISRNATGNQKPAPAKPPVLAAVQSGTTATKGTKNSKSSEADASTRSFVLQPAEQTAAIAWHTPARFDPAWLPALARALAIEPTIDRDMVEAVAAFQESYLGEAAYDADDKRHRDIDGKCGPKTQRQLAEVEPSLRALPGFAGNKTREQPTVEAQPTPTSREKPAPKTPSPTSREKPAPKTPSLVTGAKAAPQKPTSATGVKPKTPVVVGPVSTSSQRIEAIRRDLAALTRMSAKVPKTRRTHNTEESGKGRDQLVAGIRAVRAKIAALTVAEVGGDEGKLAALKTQLYRKLNLVAPAYLQGVSLTVLDRRGKYTFACNITALAMALESLGKSANDYSGDWGRLKAVANYYQSKIKGEALDQVDYGTDTRSQLLGLRLPDFLQLVVISDGLRGKPTPARMKAAYRRGKSVLTSSNKFSKLATKFGGVSYKRRELTLPGRRGRNAGKHLATWGKRHRNTIYKLNSARRSMEANPNSVRRRRAYERERRKAKSSHAIDNPKMEALLPLQDYKNAVTQLVGPEMDRGAAVVVNLHNHFVKLQSIHDTHVIVDDPGGWGRVNRTVTWEEARSMGYFKVYVVFG